MSINDSLTKEQILNIIIVVLILIGYYSSLDFDDYERAFNKTLNSNVNAQLIDTNIELLKKETNIEKLSIPQIIKSINNSEKELDDIIKVYSSKDVRNKQFEVFLYNLELYKNQLQMLTYDEMNKKYYDDGIGKWLEQYKVEAICFDTNKYYDIVNPKTPIIKFYGYSSGNVELNYDYLYKKYNTKLGAKLSKYLKEKFEKQHNFDIMGQC